MKVKKSLRKPPGRYLRGKAVNKAVHILAALFVCVVFAAGILVVLKVAGEEESSRVYAASETGSQADSAEAAADTADSLSASIAGSVSGALSLNSEGTLVRRIGTSCEKVMVGQRVKRVEGQASKLSISESMETSVNLLDSTVAEQAKSATLMSDTDYNTLVRIVEAEAGTEDVKGRVLVANVILNRVENDAFPDTVTEVVWDQTNGVAQFSPTLDGRISEVTVTDETKEAVRQALEGVDYSNGALFFIERKAASKSNVEWFETELKYLFKYGVHEFYTYPESSDETAEQENQDSSEAQEDTEENENTEEDENTVEMVKNG